MQDKNGNTERDQGIIEAWIQEGKLSPAARDMPIQTSIDQYNDVNALAPEDQDFLVHPELVPAVVRVGFGDEATWVTGWRLADDPMATGATSDIDLIRGAGRIAQEMGAPYFF